MHRKSWFILAGLFLLVSVMAASAWAQSPPIANGLNYLSSSQNPDGSWGGDGSAVTPLPATVSVLETLRVLNETGGGGYANALLWLQGQPLATTDYLSERIHALSVSGADLNLLLSYIDQPALVWGGYDDYQVNILDTALALQALVAAGYSDQSVITNALNYLIINQNADGGFGFFPGDESNVYMTAVAGMAIQSVGAQNFVPLQATAVNRARDYLLAHQNPDGGFGSSPSTVYETAYAYLALAGLTTDTTVLGGANNYLLTTQAADGSWGQDAYNTALALRAIAWAVNPPVPPATGKVTGQVVDAATNQPLGGVLVSLASDAGIKITTDAVGNFTLADIPSGNRQVNFTLAGYAPASASAQVNGSSVVNLGTIALSQSAGTGVIIKGTVTDAVTGQPIANAKVGAYSNTPLQSVQTDSAGNYTLSGITKITQNEFTLKASAVGYNSPTYCGRQY